MFLTISCVTSFLFVLTLTTLPQNMSVLESIDVSRGDHGGYAPKNFNISCHFVLCKVV